MFSRILRNLKRDSSELLVVMVLRDPYVFLGDKFESFAIRSVVDTMQIQTD